MADFIALEHLLAQGRPADATVAVRDGEPIAYARFAQTIAAWQAAFAAAPGPRWAMYFHDTAAFAAALLGAWHAGKCVYLPADTLPATVAALAAEVDGFVGDFPVDCAPLHALSAAGLPTWQPLDPQLAALVVYTSGSTGTPTAIPKRLAQLSREVATLAACWDAALGDSLVQATVSHQHIYGLLFRVLWQLAAGRPFAAERLSYAEDIVAACTAGATTLIASPAHLKRLPQSLDWLRVRPNLRGLFSSGGPLDDEALADCRRCFARAPVEVFGSSETGGIAWRRRDADDAAPWRTLPGVAVQRADGLLQVRSLHLPDDDWYTTADRVELVEGGFVSLGRADRVVKIEERRISLTAIERGLLASGLVREARALCLPGKRVEIGVAAVPTEAGWALYDEGGKHALNLALRRSLAGVVEASGRPRRWRYVWALPQNAVGKTPESAVAALFDPRRPAARLLSHTAAEASLDITIAASLPYFDGHFDAAPVLPGVALVEWAVLFARQLFTLPPAFRRMEGVKFQQLVTPPHTLQLTLRVSDATGGERKVAFDFSSATGQHAGGRIVFGDPASPGVEV